jgi:hypothetical protein
MSEKDKNDSHLLNYPPFPKSSLRNKLRIGIAEDIWEKVIFEIKTQEVIDKFKSNDGN